MSKSREQLVSDLETKLNKIPAPVLNGSYNLAVKYKEWAMKALKTMRTAPPAKLQQLIDDYRGFENIK
jgi:hypothetical protein